MTELKNARLKDRDKSEKEAKFYGEIRSAFPWIASVRMPIIFSEMEVDIHSSRKDVAEIEKRFVVCDDRHYAYIDVDSWYRERIGNRLKRKRAALMTAALNRLPSPGNEVQLKVEGLVFFVPIELSFLEQTLRDSTYMLALEDGWDEEDASSIKYETWQRAANFLVEYYRYIFSQTGKIIPAPDMLHSNRGGIDLLWEKDGTKVLMNIPQGDEPITYYGFNPDAESATGNFNYPSQKFTMALTIANLF